MATQHTIQVQADTTLLEKQLRVIAKHAAALAAELAELRDAEGHASDDEPYRA